MECQLCHKQLPNNSLTMTEMLQSLLLEKVKNGLDLPKDASNREEVFQEIKDKTTAWVAKYRRGAAFQGRPSYRSGLVGAASCVIMQLPPNVLAAEPQSPVPHFIGQQHV